jgi:hypothetical protein
MKELFKKMSGFVKIEFWAFTTIFAFFILAFIMEGFESDQLPHRGTYYPYFKEAGVPFNFYQHYFRPQLTRNLAFYVALISLNFIFVPGLLKRATRLRNLIGLIFVLAALLGLFFVTGTWLSAYEFASTSKEDVYWKIFQDSLEHTWSVLCVLAIYTGIKYAGMYLLNISGKIETKYPIIRKEAIVAAVVWLTGLLVLRFARAEMEIIIGWALVVPIAIALYLFSFYKLIPVSLAANRSPFFSYLKKCLLINAGIFLLIYIVSIFITAKDDAGLGYSVFNAFFQLFITVPVTWFLYKRLQAGNEQINVLQKELKQSSANIDFLRSQINPHFLFNALNTLYGAAIQESADKTSEGIQKLGDMMRFMLQENMQDKISVSREIDYLQNYISLQRLRTDDNPGIQITADIHPSENYLQIAPMLLIPFVENAFKHGISLREPSYIKLSLEIKDHTLYFDVSNSKHPRLEADPEKDKAGIGLENVRQRLMLSYPNKHELVIHDRPAAFFVHLTIQLTKFG